MPGPPQALLGGSGATDDAPLVGALGTFTWDALTSDSPWIVPSSGGVARPGSALSVSFLPALRVSEWQARWARVDAAGEPGKATGAGQGASGPVAVEAPARTGTWSLQVEAAFGEGRRGTWYWRLDVAP